MSNVSVSSARSGLTRRQRNALWTSLRMLITLPFVLLIMVPLIYTFMMSVLPADELYYRLWPSHFDFTSYLLVFTKTKILETLCPLLFTQHPHHLRNRLP